MLGQKATLWAALAVWVLLTPPIRPGWGIYIDAKGKPAHVSIGAPLFQWRVTGRYQSSEQCEAELKRMSLESLSLDPALAEVVAASFAKCLPQDDPRLRSPDGAATSH